MKYLKVTLLVILPLFVFYKQATAGSITVSIDNEVNSITKAIEVSHKNDTIYIESGKYMESDVVIDKPLTIIGHNQPVIDGQSEGMVLIVRSDSVIIDGITIRGAKISFVDDNAALLIDKSSYCIVRNCVFEDNFFSIYLSQAFECLVENNRIHGAAVSQSNSGNGIHLWYCKNIIVRNNHTEHNRDGIYFEFVNNSHIENNMSTKNLRYGLHFMFSDSCQYKNNSFIDNGAGVAVMYSKYVDMIDNKFLNNRGAASYGLLLKEISDSKIQGNLIKNNTIGSYIESSNRLKLLNNDYIENGWAIKIMSNSIDCVVEKNNFVSNSFQIATNSRNNSSFKNNYWSDYKGYDLDRDGYGDVPFRPVSLFALEVEKRPTTMILLRSIFVELLTLAEKIVPTFTPETLVDAQPAMSMIE